MDVAQYEMEGITEFQRKQKTEVLLLGVKGLHTKIMTALIRTTAKTETRQGALCKAEKGSSSTSALKGRQE